MKAILILCALTASALAAPPIQKRITPETLLKYQAIDPMSRLVKPEEGKAKVIRPDNQSILKDSTILNDGRNWTLVPVGAVVFTPDSMNSRISQEPTGELLPWNEFLTANRSWISTCEVSFEQAAGKDALPLERTSFWSKLNKIVIAVHQGGPISARLKKDTNLPTQ